MSRNQGKQKTFSSLDPSFCDGCGALLPPIPPIGDIHCLACKKSIPVDGFEETETTYTIYFNKVRQAYLCIATVPNDGLISYHCVFIVIT